METVGPGSQEWLGSSKTLGPRGALSLESLRACKGFYTGAIP